MKAKKENSTTITIAKSFDIIKDGEQFHISSYRAIDIKIAIIIGIVCLVIGYLIK